MTLRLYDYWRSGAGHRVRIALGLKGLAFERVAVDLRAGAQREEAFKALNPQGFVPALEIAPGVILTQSLAILEWLEETCPDPPLLPAEPRARASVRALAAAVACDVHPLGNARVLAYLRDAQGQTDAAIAAWATRWITDGFAALERLLADAPQRSQTVRGAGAPGPPSPIASSRPSSSPRPHVTASISAPTRAWPA